MFGRDKASGELTFKKFIDTDGLGRPTSIEVSSDSQFVYIAGDANKLGSYSRTGFDHNIVADAVVSNPSSLALSPEGENLYVARKADSAISIFARDPATGMLTYIEEVTNGARGIRGLNGVSSLVVTDDYFFATGGNNDSLVAFKRDDEGRLSFTQQFKNRSGSIQRLENPNSAAISPDRKRIYVGSSSDETAAGGVAWFGILPTAQPAPPFVVGYSGIEKLTVKTGSGEDIIRVAGAKVEAGSQVDVDGGAGEDTLSFDPDGNPITPQVPEPQSGNVKVFGSEFGTVHYQNVENIPGFQAAVANAEVAPAVIYEGDNLTLTASAVPATNREILSFVWDLNDNGDFGDVVATDLQLDENTNTYTATTTVPWAYLSSYGLDDDDVPDGTTCEFSLRALDNLGDFAEDTVSFTIKNAAPTVDIKGDASVNEGTPFELALNAKDPGEDTVTQYIVYWGDGVVESFASAGVVTHTYADDYETVAIKVDLEDEDGIYENAGSLELQVMNVAPEIISLSVGPPLTPEGGIVTLNCAFTDPGTLDTWNATIGRGDGSTTEIAGLGADPFESTHTYARGGIYEITLNLSDDDMGTATDTANMMVTGAGLVDGVLYVAGTSGDDRVQIDKTCNGKIKVYASFLPDRCHVRTFNAKEIERIEVYLGDGNDHATIADNIKLPVLMDGGAGNDFLNAGGGLAVIIGGEDNDTLIGGRAGDKICGGAGNDLIVGNGGNDVIDAGAGNDLVFGSCGNDKILGGDGKDLVFGGTGNDVIDGGSDHDRLFSECGNDKILGGDGNDLLVGGQGHDTLDGGAGKDRLVEWSGAYGDHKRYGHKSCHETKISPCASWVKHFVSHLVITNDTYHPNSGIKVVLPIPDNMKPKNIKFH